MGKANYLRRKDRIQEYDPVGNNDEVKESEMMNVII